MMTNTREASVRTALAQILPDDHDWQECCSADWREAFPCGAQPFFEYGLTVTVCIEQVVRAGAQLDEEDFEFYLEALLDWVFISGAPLILGESTEHLMGLLDELHPVTSLVLTSAARQNGMSLVEFLGVDRPTRAV
jgi:hypothetical protein